MDMDAHTNKGYLISSPLLCKDMQEISMNNLGLALTFVQHRINTFFDKIFVMGCIM